MYNHLSAKQYCVYTITATRVYSAARSVARVIISYSACM